jgi:hypothetical protein
MTETDRPRESAPDPHLSAQGLADSASWVPTAPRPAPPGSAWGNWGVFAGVVVLVAGLAHLLIGIVALFDAGFEAEAETDPALAIGYTAWGWIHVVGGAVLIAAGSGLFRGRPWARVVAIVFAVLNAISAMTFLPAAPAWGVVLIALDVLIVYALTVHAPKAG